MIAKQIKGRSFRGVLNYLDSKVGAQRIGGNMVGKTPPQLTAEFACSQLLNPTLQRAVYHVSLAVPREEAQSDQTWQAIADDYLKGMNFHGCQHVVYRHTDTEHDHIHVVASRTRLTDGTTVSDSWDYKRSETLVRQLEKDYSLAAVEPKDRGVRSQTTEEFRQLQRTGELSIRERLKPILQAASVDGPTMTQFAQRVLAAGVEVKTTLGKGQIRGISYALEGIAFSGTHIGRDYTFPGLQKHRGIDYGPARDDGAIALLIEEGPQPQQADSATAEPHSETLPFEPDTLPMSLADEERPYVPANSTESQSAPESPAIADSVDVALESNEELEEEAFELFRPGPESDSLPELDPLQKRCAEAIAPIAIAFFKLMQQNGELAQLDVDRWQYKGDRYVMTYDKANDSFSLEALDGRGALLQLNHLAGQDDLSVAQRMDKTDIESFYQIEQILLRQDRQVKKELGWQIGSG